MGFPYNRVVKLAEYLQYVRAFRNRVQFYFTKLKEWYRYSPCQTAPKVDPRSLVNCCPSSVKCPLRDAVLFSLSGLDYTEESYYRLMRRYDEYKQRAGSVSPYAFFKYIPAYRDKR